MILAGALARKLSFLPTELKTYSIYISTSDLLSVIISNSNKHEFSSTVKSVLEITCIKRPPALRDY